MLHKSETLKLFEQWITLTKHPYSQQAAWCVTSRVGLNELSPADFTDLRVKKNNRDSQLGFKGPNCMFFIIYNLFTHIRKLHGIFLKLKTLKFIYGILDF